MPELLFCWASGVFAVWVPKKRGTGYLRTPLGHYHNEGLRVIADAACCDVFGLDGYLSFQVPGKIYHGNDSDRQNFESVIVPMLEQHYGFASRHILEKEHHQLMDAYIKG